MQRMTAADTVKDLHVQVKRCPECGTGFGVDAAFCPFDGLPLQTGTWDPSRDPLTGTVVDRRYEVDAPLGEGGMGTVYKVRHMTLNRMFAMKVLRRDLAADAGLAARFLQEGRATAAIRHPSVVAITDFGQLDDGAPYFVMELLTGQTLATRMGGRGPMPPSEAAGIAKKLAEALGAAHAANVVHRDLKPENVFLVGAASGRAPADEIRIVDFGAAKVIGASKLTRPGVVFGTPYYMSPEQASGQAVDARADIYSLGVLLYEMITGAVPFEADTYMGVLTKHMFAAPAKASERVPTGVQLGELDEVIHRALEKDPAARYQTMKELAAALDKAIVERPSARPAGASRSGRTMAFPVLSTADKIQRSVSRHVDEENRRKRRLIAVAAIAAATTLAFSALVVTLVERPTPSSASPARPAARAAATAATTPPVAPVAPVASVAPVTAPPETTGDVPPPAPASSPFSSALVAGRFVASAPPTPSISPRPRALATEGAARPASPTSSSGLPEGPTARPSATIKVSEDFKDPWNR